MSEAKQVLSVGAYAKLLIKHYFENGKQATNEELATKIKAKFAEHGVEVKTSANCIAWYKNDMRKKNQLPKGSGGGKKIEVNLDEIDL